MSTIVLLDLYILAPDNQFTWTLAIAVNQSTSDPKMAIALYRGKGIIQP